MRNKIAGQPSPAKWVWGGRGIFAGPPGFYSSASDVKSFHMFFTVEKHSLSFSPCPPIPLWLEGKYVVCILCLNCVFQCDSAWLLPLTGLSWIPYALCLVCSWSPPSFWAPLPHAHCLLTSLRVALRWEPELRNSDWKIWQIHQSPIQ